MAKDWLAASRSEVAADRILDAAAALFAKRDAAAVGMNEIAQAAGCSRATLYRYFENREALHAAFVNREAYRLHRELTDEIRELSEPGERLVAGVTTALRMVRTSPALASWFAMTEPPIGGDADVVDRRARWLVRVITSLLIFPGNDEADEKQMLEEFVVPIAVGSAAGRR
jgi:AcrR family transcriptional regulator